MTNTTTLTGNCYDCSSRNCKTCSNGGSAICKTCDNNNDLFLSLTSPSSNTGIC